MNQRIQSHQTLGTPKFNNLDDKLYKRGRQSREFFANENYRSETNPTEQPSTTQKAKYIKTMECRVKQTNIP